MIKGSIQEKDITIISIYAPNIGAPQYVRQMLTSMKGEVNSNTIIVGGLNTTLTPMDRSTKQKFSKEIQTLNDTMEQLVLIDICKTCHPKTMNFTSFSSAHRTFSRIDHILCHTLFQRQLLQFAGQSGGQGGSLGDFLLSSVWMTRLLGAPGVGIGA